MEWTLVRKAMAAGGFLLVFLALASPALAQLAPTTAVPEIDPGTAVSGITLLVGGVLLLADKFHMRK
jgi:hypothetical protein